MHTKTHRHFVAVPLAVLLMLAVAATESILPAGAAGVIGASGVRFATAETATDFEVGWMLTGTLETQSALHADRSGRHIELVRGQVLLRSSGLTELTMGNVTVVALASSYVALHDTTSSTVVPLSAPVLLITSSEMMVLVPGSQLSINAASTISTATVPPDWYAERMQALKLLPETISPSVGPHSELAAILETGRITPAVFTHALELVRHLDPSGTAERLLLVRLLQEESRTDDDVSVRIAEVIAADKFLASELVSALPLLVAALGKPVAAVHIDAWEQATLSMGLTNNTAAVAVLRRYTGFPQMLSRAGYPNQSLLWQRALTSVAQTLRTTLSGAALTDLDTELAILMRGELTEQPALSAPVVSAPSTNWSEQQLIAIVRTMLTSKGVLMAVTTELVPDTPTQTVHVRGVFMAEQGADIPYVFTYDVARGRIANIVRDGKEMPIAVPVETFFH